MVHKHSHNFLLAAIAISVVSIFASVAVAATTVPGHTGKFDKDNNGYPDAGRKVVGHYTSLYAYDDLGNWFWDLGDGRIQGSVSSLEDLDQATLTQCDYIVNYQGDFGNDPFLNNGWIINNINCSGFDDNNQYNALIVHKTDPRYQGDPEWSIWGDWEYHTYQQSHIGNLVRPEKHTP